MGVTGNQNGLRRNEPEQCSILLVFALARRDFAGRIIEQHVVRIERPIVNRLDLDFEPGPERIDLLDQVKIDDRAVIDAERLADCIERDLQPAIEQTGGGTFWTRTDAASAADDVALPRVSLMSGARVLAGSGWMGLRDREAFVTKGVKLTPMFTGFLALAALLALMAMAWWREGR